MADGDAILIAAQSGRALAQAARRAGLRPYVLDIFGDDDTLALAQTHRALPGRFGDGRRDGRAVLDALDALAQDAGRHALGLVLGSGFEGSPDLIAHLAARHRLIGATAEAVRLLKNPLRFAALCADLSIPHPAVTTGRVADRGAWLCKRAGGSGGSHIRAATAGPAPPGRYVQVRVPGRAHALNFLSDGRSIAVLALTEQWSAPSALRPYRYAGAVARGRDEPPAVPPATAMAIVEAVSRLVEATGLRGLASADVLIDGENWWLLEINPRPGATLDVLDRRETPMLSMHIEASLGRLPSPGAGPVDAAGAEIWYAPRRHPCMASVDWPDFVCDRPRAGSLVARDAPLCTVTATGPDSEAVRRILRERAGAVAALLDGRENIDGYRREAAEHQRTERTAHRPPGR